MAAKVKVSLMDKLGSWIKNNQAIALVLGVLISALAYAQLTKPRNYEDCLLKVVTEATNDKSAIIGRQACRKKFPEFVPIPVKPRYEILPPKD